MTRRGSACRREAEVSAALILLALAVLFLAYSNGANDNFKGVATLYGSGACGYRTALVWATATTLAGSLLAETRLAVTSGRYPRR